MSALHQQQLGSDLLSASAGLLLPTLHLRRSHRCLGSVHPPTRVWVRGEGEHSLGEGGCSAAVCRALSPPQSQKSFGVSAQVAAWHQHPPQSLHGKGGRATSPLSLVPAGDFPALGEPQLQGEGNLHPPCIIEQRSSTKREQGSGQLQRSCLSILALY